MKIHGEKISAFPGRARALAGIAAAALFSAALPAGAVTLSADSTTISRLRTTTGDRTLFPVYEYLHFSGGDSEANGSTTFHLGLWGRADLVDRSGSDRTNGDVQYGYLSYRSVRNNLEFSAGRQFITEGVASEKLDGLHLRSDLAYGLTGSVFVGSPVFTDQDNLRGGEVIYGGRIAHSRKNLYDIGLSALRTDSAGKDLREELGVDLWVYPTAKIDITGRSTWDASTEGWMEHSYSASYLPLEPLKVTLSFSQINYRDYFHHVTTSVFTLVPGILDPKEESLSVGGSVGYQVSQKVTVTAEYRHFDYEVMEDADYFGASFNLALPNSLSAGISFHRMDGGTTRNSYNEFRAWAARRMGPVDLTLDFFDVLFDGEINGRQNTFSIATAAGYDLGPRARVTADLDLQRSSDFDLELRGLVKLVYAFDWQRRGKR